MPPYTIGLTSVINYLALSSFIEFLISVLVMCMFATVTEGGWQTWGQWKQTAPGVRARIRTKDTQDACPNKYQGIIVQLVFNHMKSNH